MDSWMVRAGRGGIDVEKFLRLGVIAFQGSALGDLTSTIHNLSRVQFVAQFAGAYPNEPWERSKSRAYQLLRFITAIRVGDVAVTADPTDRTYWVGTVIGEYEWNPSGISGKPHCRRTRWEYSVSRDRLSLNAKHKLNAIQGLYRIADEVAPELASHRPEPRPRSNRT